jgi:hypothetical protein
MRRLSSYELSLLSQSAPCEMAQRIVQLICPMLEAKIDLASSIEQSFVFLFLFPIQVLAWWS